MMNVDKRPGDCTPCPPERSEGSASQAKCMPAPQMLSEAKHDM